MVITVLNRIKKNSGSFSLEKLTELFIGQY